MQRTILVIDDSRTARQQVAAALADPAYRVVEAVDGRDGLEKLSAHADAALVICDLNMPNMNGLEMLLEIKRTQPGFATPFVMLTTEAQLELIQQAKHAGAKGWIVKPFKPHLFLGAVKKLLGDA